MTDIQTIMLVSGIFALVFGTLTARSSLRREPVYGGLPAHIFHGISAMTFVGLVPSVLTGLFIGAVGQALPFALSLLATSFIASVIFGVLEKPARDRHMAALEDKGWTAEDALTSGL